MLKYLLVPALVAMLIIGNDDVRVFVSAVVWSLAALLTIVAFSGKQDPEKRNALQRTWARASSAALIATLVYAGYPVLAAVWLLVCALTYAAAAHAKAKETPSNEKH